MDILRSTVQILYVLIILLLWISFVSLYVSLMIFMQARVLREFSPEEVTANIYTVVDVLLHHIQCEVQRGHLAQVCLPRTRTVLLILLVPLKLHFSEATM